MPKLIQKKDGKRTPIGLFDKKIDAIYEHVKYRRQDRVYLEEVKPK